MLPLMVAPAMVGLMYRLVLHEFAGPVPYYLFLWLRRQPVLSRASTQVFWTLVVVETLQWTPFAFLLFYMAYLGDPDRVARGSRPRWRIGGWHILRFVELPLMGPMMATAFFIRFIDGFRVFDNIYTLTGSGPGGSTASLSIYIYEAFFKQGAIGKAVAASVMLFAAILCCCSAMLNRLAGRRRAS